MFCCGVDIQSIDSDQRCVEEIRMNHGLVFAVYEHFLAEVRRLEG